MSKSTNKLVTDDMVNNLYIRPVKDSKENKSHYPDFKNHYYHQGDLLFLPDDDRYRYALVVVDVGSRLVDARPLKSKKPKEIIKAFKQIYKGDILEPPTNVISFDAGSEFKGDVANYFKNTLDVHVKVAKPNRHKQQSIVERKNKDIGKLLFKRMTAQELITGEVSKEWTDYLPTVIETINKITKKTRKRKINSKAKLEYECEGDSCNLIEEGTKVRVALDGPRNVYDDKRLHGSWRETDIRWNPKPRTVMLTSFAPGTVPKYFLDDGKGGTDNTVGYTKNQLMIIPKNEKKPTEADIMPQKEKGQEYWRVERLLSKFKKGNKIYFKVKWKNYKATTDEPRSTLIKDIPEMVKAFEKELKR